MRFAARPELHAGVLRVRVSGEWDMAVRDEFARAVAHAKNNPEVETVVVDLRNSTFLCSTSIHQLLELDERGRRDGFRLEIASGPVAERLLALTGLAKRFERARG